MQIEFDPTKNQRNIAERGLSFEQARFLEWDLALIWQDKRKEYPEIRLNALAKLGGRVHAICFTPLANNVGIRVISFRKANKREVARYEQARASNKE